MTVMISRGFWVNISNWTISRILHGLEFQAPVNTFEIDFHMEEMWKIKRKQISTKDKLIHFQWISGLIMSDQEKISWVVRGPGTTL